MLDLSFMSQLIADGGVIAYPTEGVYGLGCDPTQRTAVMRLLTLKKRPVEKGLILIASDFSQLAAYLAPLPSEILAKIMRTWPGPVTWVCPASNRVPAWIRGAHASIAVRVSAHPTVRALCQTCGHALVSTSANISQATPARSETEVRTQFGEGIDAIVPGVLGGLTHATPIYDALTDQPIRFS